MSESSSKCVLCLVLNYPVLFAKKSWTNILKAAIANVILIHLYAFVKFHLYLRPSIEVGEIM